MEIADIRKKGAEATDALLRDYAQTMLENAKKNTGKVDPKSLKKYAIISTPRVGSTLFCDTLHKAGLGWPVEWFNDIYIKQVCALKNTTNCDIPTYLNELLLGTSNADTGVFGLNFHIDQYIAFHKRGLDLMKLGFHAVYYVRRKATFKQAYSYAKSAKTSLWLRDTEIAAGFEDGVEVEITPQELMAAAKSIVDWQGIYDALFKNIVKREYVFEEFVGDLGQSAAKEIGQDLGVDITPPEKPTMEKQSNSFDQQQLQSLLEGLGIKA